MITEWRCKYSYYDDMQTVGRCLAVTELVVTITDIIGRTYELPVDFNQLSKVNPRLYQQIRDKIKDDEQNRRPEKTKYETKITQSVDDAGVGGPRTT